MPLQTSGAISLANVATEFGGATPHSLSEYYAGGGLVPAGTSGTNGAVPSSGQIALSNFYGTSNVLKYVAVGYTNSTSGTAQQNRRIYTITSSGWGTEISTGINFQNYTNQSPIAVTSDYKIIAFGEDALPRVIFVPMTTAGAGTALTYPSYSELPQTLAMYSNKFSNDKLAWAAHFNTGDSNAYQVWSFNSSTGIGTKYTNPAELPYGSSAPAGRAAAFSGMAFHPSNNVIAVGCLSTYSGTASTVLFYPWSSSGGFGTKYSQDILSVIDNEYPTSIKWSPDGNFFIVSSTHSNGHNVRTYNWSNSSGIGSLITTPANPDSDQFWQRVPQFFKSGDKVLLGRQVYNWSSSTGYGSLIASVSYDGAQFDYQHDVSVDGDFVIMRTSTFSTNLLPFNLYPWNNSTGFGTVLAKPSIPAGSLTAGGITAKFGKV